MRWGLGTVTTYLQRATAAGLTWPLPDDLDDAALEARLFARPAVPPARDRVVPDWGQLHQELKKPGVTLALLWQEYRGAASGRLRLQPVLRAVSPVGAGAEAVDAPGASRRREALCRFLRQAAAPGRSARPARTIAVELFVGVLGASGLIYAEATRSQDLPSWIGAHVRMLDYFQGSPAIWVPDNLKSGVTTASRYEPEINRTYAELARHYGAVVIPARVAHADRQTQSRGQCPDRPALDPGGAAAPHLFHARRSERRHPRARRRDQRPPDEGHRRQPAGALRAARSAGARAVAARRATSWRSGSRVASTSTITSRSITTSTACRISSCTRGSRRASRRRPSKSSSRAGASRRTCGSPAAAGLRRSVAHMPRAHRAHAEWTPSRLIAWADADRPGDRPARRGHPRAPAASRARLPRVPRADAARPAPRRRSARGRLCTAPSGCAPIAIAPSNTFSSTSRTGSRSRIRPLPVRR